MWKYRFHVPENKRTRVVVHTDCKNEADNQYALAHHLMTPKFDVRKIIAGHFDGSCRQYGPGNTEKASYNEILTVLDLMGLNGAYPVFHGAVHALADTATPIPSEGADFIIQEAMRDDDRPLYIAYQGASALLMRPEIAKRMTVIWIGGGNYPAGGNEFNHAMDIPAANVVFSSDVPVWQITKGLYKQFAVTLAELQRTVYPCGELGKCLFEELIEVNEQASKAGIPWPHGELWRLGDQGTIAVLMEELERVSYELIKAPTVLPDMTYSFENQNRPIRVYHSVDPRLVLEVFLQS